MIRFEMPTEPLIQKVLSRFFSFPARGIEPLKGAGGFSGAGFWRVSMERDDFCLRRWPPGHPDEERLRFIHGVLNHVAQQGIDILPVPIPDRTGASFVRCEGAFWELTRWLPGAADFRQAPNDARLDNALRKLAEFHQAAAGFPAAMVSRGKSPGIRARLEQLHALQQSDLARITAAVEKYSDGDFQQRARQILRAFARHAGNVEQLLKTAVTLDVPLQVCIRDIWHDHVLFTGDEVTGIVDFGAMRVDTVAGDIARLVGSLVGDSPEARALALQSYQTLCPLSEDERWLVNVFDHSGVLLSGMNWLQWICVERRRFDDQPRVLERLDAITERLELHMRS